MQLVISVGQIVLERISIDSSRSKDQEYIHALCQLLFKKHEISITALQEAPSFYLEVCSSFNSPENEKLE